MAVIRNKKMAGSVLGHKAVNDSFVSVRLKEHPKNAIIIQISALTSAAYEENGEVLWEVAGTGRTGAQRRCFDYYERLEYKNWKSRRHQGLQESTDLVSEMRNAGVLEEC